MFQKSGIRFKVHSCISFSLELQSTSLTLIHHEFWNKADLTGEIAALEVDPNCKVLSWKKAFWTARKKGFFKGLTKFLRPVKFLNFSKQAINKSREQKRKSWQRKNYTKKANLLWGKNGIKRLTNFGKILPLKYLCNHPTLILLSEIMAHFFSRFKPFLLSFLIYGDKFQIQEKLVWKVLYSFCFECCAHQR